MTPERLIGPREVSRLLGIGEQAARELMAAEGGIRSMVWTTAHHGGKVREYRRTTASCVREYQDRILALPQPKPKPKPATARPETRSRFRSLDEALAVSRS